MKDQLIASFTAVYGRAPEIITRAPGRIEFIGNHTDYNGGIVLGAATDCGVWVALAASTEPRRRFHSPYRGGVVELPAEAPTAQAGVSAWTNYPLGVLAALPEFGFKVPAGFDYLALSDLPTGAGLSSSAAIELASVLAFLELTSQKADRETVVKIGKHAENHFVGVPCGILDQGVSGFGKADHLVLIDCRGPHFETVPMPAGTHFWIFNTPAEHALVDGFYAARNQSCVEAAKVLGVSLLVEADRAALEAGRDQLSAENYRRAKHVIEEIARVRRTVDALAVGDLPAVGALLTVSHRSSQHLFENSTVELDFLVDRLAVTAGVYGARLTGGGFGGAVMALTDDSFNEAGAKQVADAYRAEFGTELAVLHMRTGDGASVRQSGLSK